MNVALITLEGGGTASVCYGLANSLARKEISTAIFTEKPRKISRKKYEKISQFSPNIKFLNRLDLPPRFLWFQLQNFRYLLGSLVDFDVVHGVSPDASVLLALRKRELNKPFVVSIHSEPLSYTRDFFNMPFSSWTLPGFAHQILEFPLLRYNLKICSEKADHIMFCSYSILKEFKIAYKKLDLNKVSVVYNAINLKEFDSGRTEYSVNDENDELSIVFIGRLMWVKGLLYLLKAFRILVRDFKKVRLEIFGKGPEESRLKKLVSNWGLDDKVHFHGYVPKKMLIPRIKKASIVISPSIHEAQSMTVLEAMACRKPIITFDIPSMSEIIVDGETGVLAKPFSHSDLAEKIRIVLSDKKLRSKLGQNAYNYVKEKHNWDRQVEKYVEIYENVR